MTQKVWVADTNFIYEGLQETFGQYKIALVSTVKQELDKHKTALSEELKWKARQANRFIFEHYDSFIHDTKEYNPEEILGEAYSRDIMDNRIVACAKENGYGILTNDLNMYTTAKDFGLEVKSYNEQDTTLDMYKGFKEVKLSSSELIEFNITSLGENVYDLNINEYLILTDELGNKEVFIWTGESHERVKENLRFTSDLLGEFKARDIYQLIAMDSIIRNQFTMIRGHAGTAKTQSALSYAIQEVRQGRNYDKLIVITNNLPAKNAWYNGWVKGSLLEKLMDSSIGNMLSSKLGDKDYVQDLVKANKLEIIPLSDVRGWEATPNSIVLISEAQNFNISAMQLAIQRIPETCKLIIEGDNETQLDDKSFEGLNNGMTRVSEIFKGQDYFGTVELQNIYRSQLARQADLMTRE